MNIVVTIKQVVDPNLPPSYINLDATGKRIVSPFGVAPVMNGYDANALEAALKLREAHGGRVTAVCLGDDTARATVTRALAMGADAATLLNDPDWLNLDSAGVGQVLAAAIRKTGPFDLVLCGRQASDTDGGQVLYWIAEALGLSAVCPISKIESVADGDLLLHRPSNLEHVDVLFYNDMDIGRHVAIFHVNSHALGGSTPTKNSAYAPRAIAHSGDAGNGQRGKSDYRSQHSWGDPYGT